MPRIANRWWTAAVLFLCGVPTRAGEAPAGALLDDRADRRFPPCAAVVDVTRPPYLARGDGRTDDTAALQRALADAMGRHRILYLPNGTYLVSKSLVWTKKNADGQDAWGFNWVQGQNPRRTVLRLKDATFTDPARPQAVISCGGFGSADWFHNYVQDLTIDVGRGNPGAVGLEFYSNNTGAVRGVTVRSGDGQGVVGLDLGHRDMNGPLLVRDVAVEGFDVGIRAAASVNSQTLEAVTLRGQSTAGIVNLGQSLAVRRLRSENAVTAVRAEGFTVLDRCELVGRATAARLPAVVTGPAPFLAEDLTTNGYAAAVVGEGGRTLAAGPDVARVTNRPETAPFGSTPRPPALEVEETPEAPWDDPAAWAVVDRFGADPTGQRDSSEAVQKAVDSGATTVFFPGAYRLTRPVVVRGPVRRLLGTGNWIDYNRQTQPDLILEDGPAPVVFLEHFAPINGGVEVRTDRTVVVRSVEAGLTLKGRGRVFLEDVATHGLRLGPGRSLWARQLNVENEGTHVTNDGGRLWVLGYKTERGGTLLHTRPGGVSEVLGTFSYTTTAGKLAPMFVTEDAAVFAFLNEVCYSGDPFAVLVRETRGGVTRVVKRGEGATSPYVAPGPRQ